ncbi:MAG: DUF4012 domain-containing protein, partial [Patescibacteria group bacterium]|nr:DUF4012 domain-containing protein [Patescibacteria group bacterium]
RSGNDDKNVFLPRKNKHREQILAKDFLGKKPIDFILTNTNDLDILPSREDLLAELDKIENFEEFLKKVEVSKGFINSSAEPALSDSEAPQNDIEKTLRKCQTLKPKSAIYKKSRYSKGLALKNTRERRKKLEQAFNIEEFYFPEVARETVLDGENMAKSGVSKWRRGTAGWDWSGRSKPLINFLISGIVIALIVPLAAWIGYGFKVKQDVLSSGLSAYQNLLSAKQALEQTDWQNAEYDFGLARADFFEAHQEINKLGQLTLGIIEQLPGGSLVASGSHLVKVGENLAQAGQGLAAAANLFSFNNLFNSVESLDSPQKNILALKNNKPLTESIVLSKSDLSAALENIRVANQELEQIKISSLPDDIQENIVFLKAKLPLVEEAFFQALDYSEALLSILGHDNSRKYLLIFQNNGEVRATGGFIGTYGLLTLDQGRITDLFIDGVYNADGQLHEKIIPPRPLQKISTAWSMHDANWFADFPSSAEKIAWFYEKTGGPTVDGVISLTPAVIERFLKLTGPISMPEYGVVLDSSNFVELIQYKVEIDYDKELNRPKKILADFTPKFIEAISGLSSQKRKKALEIIFDCFEEKHILTYFSNPSLEKLAKKEGWSGEVASTEKDYLSVVSSNINGYKTDKMIKETIQHQAEIQEDGSIVDTLTITRQHQGGRSEYDWWNKVNSNYLRVYLPLGSQLISANGQSLEIYQPPIDYQKHNFKKDALVDSIESKMIIDKKTGTRIFEESGKTVFANWAYVSPGETVVLSYKYKLPFKIDLTKPADSYSLLAQKQLGSLGSSFNHQIKFPNSWRVSWKYPENLNSDSGFLKFDGDLKTDKFLGASFKF